MLPVGVQCRVERFPWVTASIILVNVALFLPRYWMGYYEYWDFITPYLFRPAEANLAAAIACMFLHADKYHIFYNMVFLWFFGAVLEDRIGRLPFLAMYIITGFAAIGMHCYFIYTYVPEAANMGLLGASGALSGVMGAFMCRCYFRKVSVMTLFGGIFPAWIRVRSWLLILFFFVINVVWGVKQAQGAPVFVAYWAHVGGLLSGFGIAIAVGYRRQGRIENCREIGKKLIQGGTDMGTAQQAFEKIVELDPHDYEAMASLGELHSRFNLTNKGNVYYRRAIMESMNAGYVDKAVEIYMAYLPRYFGAFNPQIQMELTRGLISINRLHLAALGLEEWLKANPCSSARHTMGRHLAVIYRRMGAKDLAEKTLRNAKQEASIVAGNYSSTMLQRT